MYSFKVVSQLHNMTETEYVHLVKDIDFESLQEGMFDGVKGYIVDMYNRVKQELQLVADEIEMSSIELALMLQKAFKEPTFFNFMKAFGFSIQKMLKAVLGLTELLHGGLQGIFIELNKLKIFQQVQSGAMSIDQVLSHYPMLKKVSGPVLAALILIGWINMTFIGNVKYDFKWDQMLNAVKGKETIASVLTGPKGMMFLALLALGTTTGFGVAWFGLAGNIIFALIYTAYTMVPNADRKALAVMKKKMRKMRSRGIKSTQDSD